MAEITLEEFDALKGDNIRIIDVRNREAFEYGAIDGAENIPLDELCEGNLDKSEKTVIYCKSGILTREKAEDLCETGYDVLSLKEGFVGWLRRKIETEDEAAARDKIEKSIQKKFKKQLFSRFAAAINKYGLLKEGDRVAVCISGGKDSMLMAKLFQELHRHGKFLFELVFLVMDPGYSPENREIIEKNAKLMGIPVTIFESTIFDAVYNIEKSPCYVCARMRRGYLYSKAKELGCNKIALGHHYDDVIETILMGMLYSGQFQTMMPKLKSTNFEGMELIRPMYLIREDDIKAWRDYNGLNFIQCACKFTDTCTSEACLTSSRTGSKRLETKNIIRKLKETNRFVEGNIFKSVENVNLETIISYKDKNGSHSILEDLL
ncbi:MAG: ATP-binding protein [Clostridia bacterium]|nr:ATP-binding protein [Clostridia bacterium]